MYSLILHGRSLLQIQKCRHFRFAVNFLQNASAFSNSFSSACAPELSPRNGRKGNIFTIAYLVDSLGLTSKLAESISKKVNLEDKGNPDSVLNLLRSNGFRDSQISNIIITIYPRLLVLDSEKSLGPKLKFLQSRGALSTSELTEILSKDPKILGMKRDKAISRYLYLTNKKSSSKFENLCLSLPQSGRQRENKIQNVSVLRELGEPRRFLFPLVNSNSPSVYGKQTFEETFKKAVEMGFDRTASKFVDALRIVYGLREKTLEEKVGVYEKLGLDVGDVWEMFKKCPVSLTHSEKKITQTFEALKKCGLLENEVLSVFKKFPKCIGDSEEKIENAIETFVGIGFSRDEFMMMVKRYPPCIGLSPEKAKKKIEFLVKKMNWSVKDFVLSPQVLGYSMEKKIVRRCKVIKSLRCIEFFRSGKIPSMWSVLGCTDQMFVKRYVRLRDYKKFARLLMPIFTRKTRMTRWIVFFSVALPSTGTLVFPCDSLFQVS